jgi:hypothetical protein
LIEHPIVSRVAHISLVLLGLIALAASWQAVSNYVTSLASVRSLELEITDVRRSATDSSQLIVQFRLHNRSELPIRINSYFFDLHLNGTRIGGSYSTWRDDDPDPDRSLYSRASTIDRTLAPHEHLDMEFPLHIFDLDLIMAAHQEHSWSAEAGFRLIHPHGRDERLVRLQAAQP